VQIELTGIDCAKLKRERESKKLKKKSIALLNDSLITGIYRYRRKNGSRKKLKTERKQERGKIIRRKYVASHMASI
jgi:hypothetical protein